MKLIVTDDFWELFPEAQLHVLVVRGLNNRQSVDQMAYFEHLLEEASQAAQAFITDESFAQNLVIQEWRQAYTRFKTKKGARSSIEALLKRVAQSKVLRPINPLVDLYNSVSLRYGVPCGGEDLAAIQGDLRLGKAKGGEAFFPLGALEDDPALPGEIIYADDDGAICRNFNWREAQRTMLTEDTRDALLIIESLNAHQADRAKQAMMALSELVTEVLGCQGRLYQVTAAEPSMIL